MLDKNMKILSDMGFSKKYIDEQYYEIEKSRDNMSTFKYISENGKQVYINSIYNTSKEIENLLQDYDFDKDNLFIVYGIGMAHHIKEIYNRMTANSYILVIEKDKTILSTFLRNEDISELINKNTLFVFGEEEEIVDQIYSSILRINLIGSAVNCISVFLPSYKTIYGMEFIHRMNLEIIDIVKHALFLIGNDVQDTIDGIVNYVENIKPLLKSPKLEDLKDAYANKPAIIVSAGPSLDKNVHLLKNAQGKALILATDAVLSTLEKHSIVPDAVFTVERALRTYEVFYKDKQINKDIVLVAPSVIRKEIIDDLEDNKKLVFLKEGEGPSIWVTNEIVKENRYLVTGSSCAHTAFSFSRHLGANPIMFVGQDLAFTKDGVTHANAVEIKSKENVNESVFWVDGVDGEKLPTNWVFKNFLIWFEKEIAKDESGREYIDCTEGGAYKRGTKLMFLKDAINKYCTEDITRLYDILPEDSSLDERYLNSATALNKLKKEIKNLITTSKKQNRKITRFINNNYEDEEAFVEAKIDKGLNIIKANYNVEKKIFNSALFVGLFQPLLMSAVIEVRKLGCNINREVIRENMKIQIKMNKNIIIGCNRMILVIDKLLNEIVKDKEYIELASKE